MCSVCGTPLALAEEAPQAQRERAYIERADRAVQVEGPDQARAGRPVRRQPCWRCRATRATTAASRTSSSTSSPPLGMLLAAAGIAVTATLAAPAAAAGRRRQPPATPRA